MSKGNRSAKSRSRRPGGVPLQSVAWWWREGVRFHLYWETVHGWLVKWGGYPVEYTSFELPGGTRHERLSKLSREAEEMLKKSDQKVAVAGVPRVLSDPAFTKKWPTLWDYLTQTKWEDGSARQTGTMLIFPAEGVLKIMLNDKEAGQTLWAASGTINGLFDCLEAAVNDPAADWRADRKQAGDTAKRHPKRS